MPTLLAYPSYQINSWGSNYLDDAGRRWYVTGCNIQDGLNPKTHITERSLGHGAYRAQSFLSGRPVTMTGKCIGLDRITREDARDLLLGLFVDGGQQLFTYHNGVRARTLLVELNDTPRVALDANQRTFTWQLSLFAADGRMLDVDALTAGPATVGGVSSDGLDWATGGGLDWLAPAGAGTGLDWGVSGVSGVLVLTNTGNVETYPVFTVLGPVTAPSFTDVSTGRQILWSDTVAAGQTLVIDTSPDNRSAKLNGVDRFSSLVFAQWFVVPAKGVPLTVQFGGSGGGSGSATWRNASL